MKRGLLLVALCILLPLQGGPARMGASARDSVPDSDAITLTCPTMGFAERIAALEERVQDLAESGAHSRVEGPVRDGK